MSEFGHVSMTLDSMMIDRWGVGPYSITVGSKAFLFEDSTLFGPYLIKRNGEIFKNPWPSEKSPFWDAHTAWVLQGRQVEKDRVTCIYEMIPSKPMEVRHEGGGHYEVVENGDGDPENIEIVK